MALKTRMLEKYVELRKNGETHEKALRLTQMWARKAKMIYGITSDNEVSKAAMEIDAEYREKDFQ